MKRRVKISKKAVMMATVIPLTLAIFDATTLSINVYADTSLPIQKQIEQKISFNDVPADHWAYPAIKQLADAGLIEGYDSKFLGDKTMSRYEMAVLVSKAIEKLDKADAVNQKLIFKLTSEFSDEIDNLKIRMDKVENNTKTHLEGQIVSSASANSNPNYKIGGGEKYGEVFRVRFISGNADDKLSLFSEVAGYMTAGERDAMQGNNFIVNQGYFRVKDIFGLDMLRVGRMDGNIIGIGGPLYQPGNSDGIELNKKIGQTNWKLWTGNVAPTQFAPFSTTANSDADEKHPNQVTTLEATYGLSSKLTTKLGGWWNGTSAHNATDGGVFNAGAGAGFDKQSGIQSSWIWKLGDNLELIADGTYDTLSNPTGGLKNHPIGYAVGLIHTTDSHRPGVFPRVMGLCDFHHAGASGWSIGYGSNDAGVAPVGMAHNMGYIVGGGTPYTLQDNTNVLSGRYEYVLREGLSADVILSKSWIKDKSMRPDLTPSQLNGDKSIVLELTAFFY